MTVTGRRPQCHGDDVVDGARRAHAHALAAPRAPRVLRVSISTDDDLCVSAAIRDVEHAHDLNVLACPHAARAEDAEIHVVLDDGITVALVAESERKLSAPLGGDVVAANQLLELIAVAASGDVVDWVPLEEHAEHSLSTLHRSDGLGRYDHSF